MFHRKITIHLKDTDATGVLYFSQQLQMAQETLEEYLSARGLPLGALLKEDKYLLPIVHVEADYTAAVHVGDLLEITLEVAHVGTTSFTLVFKYYRDKKQVGSATLVHVVIARAAWRKEPIPPLLLAILDQDRS